MLKLRKSLPAGNSHKTVSFSANHLLISPIILLTVHSKGRHNRQQQQTGRDIGSGVGKGILKLKVSFDYGNAVLAALPTCQLHRLQSVLNASARLIFGLRRYDHVSSALRSLHWLCVKERIHYKLATLTFRALHGLAPQYISASVSPVAEVEARRRLRSAAGHHLLVPRHHLHLGAATFSVAGPIIWNSLPASVASASSLVTFGRLLKTYLFDLSHN